MSTLVDKSQGLNGNNGVSNNDAASGSKSRASGAQTLALNENSVNGAASDYAVNDLAGVGVQSLQAPELNNVSDIINDFMKKLVDFLVNLLGNEISGDAEISGGMAELATDQGKADPVANVIEGTDGSDTIEVDDNHSFNTVNTRGGDDVVNIGNAITPTETNSLPEDNTADTQSDTSQITENSVTPAEDNTQVSDDEDALPTGNQISNLDLLDEKDQAVAQNLNLSSLDENGNPIYLVAEGKDGNNHLYELASDGGRKPWSFSKGSDKELKYTAVNEQRQGSNNLYVKEPEKNRDAAISTDDGDLIENVSDSKTGSPLILDMDNDNKVEAKSGSGVDIDGNGIVDGAASGGDKMLAMSDLDQDGRISGKEVFGDNTIDPFTHKPVFSKEDDPGAVNGFEALRRVAASAENHTGIDCINAKGQVDVQKLQQALSSKGVSLGMISGGNNSALESGLSDIALIDTANYETKIDSGDIQHRQVGFFTTTDGDVRKVDDVWFKLN